MKGNFTVVSVTPNGEIHGDDTEIGVGIKLSGLIDESFANRFAFGSDTGVCPDNLSGRLTQALWVGDSPAYPGIEKIPANGKFAVSAKINGISLATACVSKCKLTPAPKSGQFEALFQVYQSCVKKGPIGSLCELIRQTVVCEIVVIQTDIEEG